MPDETPPDLNVHATTPDASHLPPAGGRAAHLRAAFNDLPRWARRGGVIFCATAVALFVVAIVGVGTSIHNYNTAGDLLGEVRVLEGIEAEQAERIGVLETHNATYERLIKEAEDATSEMAAAVEEREVAVAAAEEAVANRETAAGAAEAQKAKQQFSNGVRVIGNTIEPGIYETSGPTDDMCYYAWKSSTGSDADIVDNNLTEGSATVTLVAGEIFESKMCKLWTKVG